MRLYRIFFLILLIIACLSGRATTIDTISITTNRLPFTEEVIVITPEAAHTEARPTIYLLNGYGGNHLAWLTIRPDLPELADNYGFHFVMPHGHDTWYWDSPVDSTLKMESFIVEELVPYIDKNYKTLADSSKRAITGLSMGGHGALWLAMRHPDIWQNAGAMSGGVDIRPFPDRWKMKQWIGTQDEHPDVWDSHTVINLVDKLQPDKINIVFDCGVDDFFFNVNTNLHHALLDRKIPHDFTARPGNHSQGYWANSILYHLLFFSENFKK